MSTNSESYESRWNGKASNLESAIAAVDGSPDEDILRHTGKWSAAQVRAALDIGPEHRVLDLGCGVARIGRELAPHCREWIGVDISENMLECARPRLEGIDNVQLHQLQRSSLDPVDDDSVDRAYCIAVFCHMDKEDLYLYLQDLYRVLAPGGLIFVETWNLAHPAGWNFWRYEPLNWSKKDQRERKDVARNQFCTPEEFEIYVTRAGFRTLANYNDSQSVQIVAGKGLDDAALERERARLDKVQTDVAYSPRYAEYFTQFVDVQFGMLKPAEMLANLDANPEAPETALFRPYLLSIWRKNTAVFGEPPKSD